MDKSMAIALLDNPHYRALLEELNKHRPPVPTWNPVEDNTRQMQFASAQRAYHDLMMAILYPFKK